MKGLLLDQGLAPSAAAIHRRNGIDAVHVAKIGMERAEDSDILEPAREDERVCITLDHDFHAHLAVAGYGRPSVVLLRVQGLDARGQADLIRSVCVQCDAALTEGAAVSADRESIRVRRLPLKEFPRVPETAGLSPQSPFYIPGLIYFLLSLRPTGLGAPGCDRNRLPCSSMGEKFTGAEKWSPAVPPYASITRDKVPRIT